jgi:hypothetical protein
MQTHTEVISHISSTFFQDANNWPMLDNADPLHGWSSKEVEDRSTGPATADIYGKLFYHVRAMVQAFVVRLSGSRVAFRLFQMDATDLVKNHLESNSESFNRIEVRSFLRPGQGEVFQSAANADSLCKGLQYLGWRVSRNT